MDGETLMLAIGWMRAQPDNAASSAAAAAASAEAAAEAADSVTVAELDEAKAYLNIT